MTAVHEWTATKARHEIARGVLTREEYLNACLDRIDALESDVGAWAYIDIESALQRARILDQNSNNALLSGIPFGIKDIIDTAAMPTQLGSEIYAANRPAADAACVALACKAGGIALGKTVTTEFANLYPGKTRNPFDLTRTPGGSSSGSAAAVGACMVPIAIGTQTTASTIRPASFCGVYGFIPSQGRVSCSGVRQASWTFDRLGLFARSVSDIALLYDVVRGAEHHPITPLLPLRVGFCRTHLWDQLEPTTRALLEGLAEELRRNTRLISDMALPLDVKEIEMAHRQITSFEFTKNFTFEIENHIDRISPTLRSGRIADGLSCTFEMYERALHTIARSVASFDRLMGDYDVILTAGASGEAPTGVSTGNASFCIVWTALGVPCISIPAFKGPNGLPVGFQLVGKKGGDLRLLEAATWISELLNLPKDAPYPRL